MIPHGHRAYDNYFLQAQRLRTLVRADFDRVFRVRNILSSDAVPPAASQHPPSSLDPASTLQMNTGTGIDVLVHPSAIRTAPRLSDAPAHGLETYVQDVLTVPASLAGVPALNVPAGCGPGGWPVGVSVVGQWGCDEVVMKVGEVIEGVGESGG